MQVGKIQFNYLTVYKIVILMLVFRRFCYILLTETLAHTSDHWPFTYYERNLN